MKKPHITTTKTYEFTHPNGKQKIKLTEVEAQEFLQCLCDTLDEMHIPQPLLSDLFKTKEDRGMIPDPRPFNPLDLIGKEFPRPLDIIYGPVTCENAG